MKQFDKLFGNILSEQDNRVLNVGIFPGAFKPPHVGHYTTALNACNDNEKVYIFVSDKPRPISTQSKGGKDVPDGVRYANIIKSDKYTSELLSVRTASVARMTSATAFRAAVSVKDKSTIVKNIPTGVDVDQIFSILMQSNDISNPNYGHVSIDQTMAIWNIYKQLLIKQSRRSEQDIIIKVSSPSPVKDTYDLVDQLNKSDGAGMTSIRLYVGE